MTATGSLADATRAVLLGVRLRAVATADDVRTSLDPQGVVVDDQPRPEPTDPDP